MNKYKSYTSDKHAVIFIKNKRTKGHDGHLSSNELRGGGCYRVKGILDYLYLISRSKKFLTFGNKRHAGL